MYKKKISKRKLEFQFKTTTNIWEKIPSRHNPYLAVQKRIHGYDLIELVKKRSFVDVLFLLFTGELPTTDQAALLETLMIGLINPGFLYPFS